MPATLQNCMTLYSDKNPSVIKCTAIFCNVCIVFIHVTCLYLVSLYNSGHSTTEVTVS